MAIATTQTWETIEKLHSQLLHNSSGSTVPETDEACDGLKQAANRLLHGDAMRKFILSQRPDLILYAIQHFVSEVRTVELIELLVRRSLQSLEMGDATWNCTHCVAGLQHSRESLHAVDMLIGLQAVNAIVEHMHVLRHGAPARFPCCCHLAGSACQVIHAIHQSLKHHDENARFQCLSYLLTCPDTPSALYPSTDKSRLLFLCQSILSPTSPCFLCHTNRPKAPAHASFNHTGPGLANACLMSSPMQHLPSIAALSSAAQLASKAMGSSPAACLELMPTCCSFIQNEYLSSTAPAASMPRRAPSPWTSGLTFRGYLARDCDRFVAMLLGGIMDAFNTHFVELANSPLATRVPELCCTVLSATHTPHPAHEATCRAVAVRGLAVLAWRHRGSMLAQQHLRAQRLPERVLQCLDGAMNVTSAGKVAFLVRSVVGHLQRKLQQQGGQAPPHAQPRVHAPAAGVSARRTSPAPPGAVTAHWGQGSAHAQPALPTLTGPGQAGRGDLAGDRVTCCAGQQIDEHAGANCQSVREHAGVGFGDSSLHHTRPEGGTYCGLDDSDMLVLDLE